MRSKMFLVGFLVCCILSSWTSLAADGNMLTISLLKLENFEEYVLAGIPAGEIGDRQIAKTLLFVPFVILFSNEGMAPIRIFNSDNSVGYGSISFEVKIGDEILRITKRDKKWFRNILTWTVINPKEHFGVPFIMNGAVWDNVSIILDGNITIRVLFIQEKLADSIRESQKIIYKEDFDFFEGKIVSEWYNLKISKARVLELSPVKPGVGEHRVPDEGKD